MNNALKHITIAFAEIARPLNFYCITLVFIYLSIVIQFLGFR